MLAIEESWKQILAHYFDSQEFAQTSSLVQKAYLDTTVYPVHTQIFRAFELTSFDQVRVVILGQDPYHGPGQAMGLSFSVPPNTPLPPSLRNIYREINNDLEYPSACAPSGDLSSWAQQGVLLLNSVLTVEANKPASHQSIGWQHLTDQVISQLSTQREHIVFILWGSYARSKKELIDHTKHLVLESPHPSPLSAHRGFMGSRPFSQTNNYLEKYGYQPIKW